MLRHALCLILLSLSAFHVSAQIDTVRQVMDQIGGEWIWVETRVVALRGETVLTPESEGYTERIVFDVQTSHGGNGQMLRDGALVAEDSFDLERSATPSEQSWVWMDWGSIGQWWVQLAGDALILHADAAGGPRVEYRRSSVGVELRSLGAVKSLYAQP